MSVELDCSYEGANPSRPDAIEKMGESHFKIYPYSEDGDGNYKFAMSVRATNRAGGPELVTLEVDWQDEQYMSAREFVHIGGGDDWRFLPADVEGSIAKVRHELQPGISYVGLCPSYDLDRHLRFAQTLPALGYKRSVPGHSEEGRELEAFSLGEGPVPILVTARFHPYETASSYCVEGLMNWVATGEAEALRRRYHFTIMPMSNPDGVRLGLCKRTSDRGVDLEHEGAFGGDATARGLLDLMAAVKPVGHLDIHGWMHFDEDGAFHLNEALVTKFIADLGGNPALAGNRVLPIDVSENPYPGWPQTYVAREYGAEALEVSYRWPSRTVPAMRALGGPTLRAFCEAVRVVRGA
jgi:hypothetical protein